MSEPHLLTQVLDGNILVATLNRPKSLNAMSMQMMRLLEGATDRFRDSPELKVMLIRAKGRYFSSGADLKEDPERARTCFNAGSEIRERLRRLPSGMRRVWNEMEAIEKPIVVAHHAMCVGGGLEMSLSCDFRLASSAARYAFPEARFGALPATNGISRLVRIVGPHWARLLVTANVSIDAEEARTMGLVHKVYPEDTFEDDVQAFCRHLALQDSEFMGASKIAIELAADLAAYQAASVERLVNASLMLGPPYQTLLKAHVSKIGTTSE